MALLKLIFLALKLDSKRAYLRGLEAGQDVMQHCDSFHRFYLMVDEERAAVSDLESEFRSLVAESGVISFYVWLKKHF